MKKSIFIALAAAAALILTSCSKTTTYSWISWGVSFKGSQYAMSEACAISKVYRTAFSEYGKLDSEKESTGGSCYFNGATSERPVKNAFEQGIEDANNILQNEHSYTISTTKPDKEGVFTVSVKAEWSDWNDSRTFYLTK